MTDTSGSQEDTSSSKKRDNSRSRSRNKNKKERSRRNIKKEKEHRKKQEQKLIGKRSSSHWRRRNTPHFDYEENDYIKQYKIKDHIADGTFGRCLLVKHKVTKKYYAAKVIKPVEKYIYSAKEETELCDIIRKKDKDSWCGR